MSMASAGASTVSILPRIAPTAPVISSVVRSRRGTTSVAAKVLPGAGFATLSVLALVQIVAVLCAGLAFYAAIERTFNIIVTGVGGTGVITIGQLLGMAAHMEGKGIVTQDAAGLAQKGGATWSHVLIGATQDDIRTTRVGMAAADLIIGCDPIVAANKETVLRMREGRTHVALNSHSTPTAAFVKDGAWQNPQERCAADVARAVGAAGLSMFDADAIASQLMGDTLYVNPMILGYAWQKGWVPLARESLMRAIELNNVQVENNKTAFEWGRQAAHDRARVERLLAGAGGAQVFATEPVPAYLAAAAGFVDVTPSAFSEAVEEGQDVPPATMLEALDLLASGDVDVVITNAQTGGAETEAVTDAAADAGISVLAFTELLPDGDTYTSWMQRNLDELAGTLTR